MTAITRIPMRPGLTITMGGTSELVSSRPRRIPASDGTWQRAVALYNRSDAHRKIIGHVLFLAMGLIAAAIEIHMDFSPMVLTVTQFVLPAIIQEAYDFTKQL